MGLFSALFGKKKKKDKYESASETEIKKDPQEQYLKKEEPKKVESPKTVKSDAAKNDAPKAEEKKPVIKRTASTQKKMPEAEKTELKSAPAASKEDEPNDKELESAETVTSSKPTRNGNFEIKKAKDGRYFFNLCASNKVVIAYSQIYASSSSAVNGIKSIIANAPKAAIEDTTLKKPTSQPFPKWEIYIDKAGKHRLRLYAPNGSCVCHSSRGYATKATCKGGIESIIRFAVEDADINKTYLK